MPTIVAVPDQILRVKTTEINSSDTELVLTILNELEETLIKQSDPPGVGLAAPQIGRSERVFATYLPISPEDETPILRVYLNPRIEKSVGQRSFTLSDEDSVLEGCLSIPHLYGPVPRFDLIEISGQIAEKTPDGELNISTVDEKLQGYASRVFQHELDHLYGTLFTDYTLSLSLPLYEKQANDSFKPISRSVITWGDGS